MLNKNGVCTYNILYVKSQIYRIENMYDKIYKTANYKLRLKMEQI